MRTVHGQVYTSGNLTYPEVAYKNHQVTVFVASFLKTTDQHQIVAVPEAFPVSTQLQLGGTHQQFPHERKLIRNPDFIKMCVLYPHLARDREAASVAFRSFREVSQQEERRIQTSEYARVLRDYFISVSRCYPWQEDVNVTSFLQCKFLPGLEGMRKNGEPYVLVACGRDVCKNSFFMRKKLICRDKQALWRIALTLAYFGQKLPGNILQ